MTIKRQKKHTTGIQTKTARNCLAEIQNPMNMHICSSRGRLGQEGLTAGSETGVNEEREGLFEVVMLTF